MLFVTFELFCLLLLNTEVNQCFTFTLTNKSVLKQEMMVEETASGQNTYVKVFQQECLASGNKKRPGSRVVTTQREL